MALITLGTGIGLAGSYIKNNDRKSKLLGLIPAAAAAIIFVSSQHMGGRMVLADSWTIPMTCLMALNIALGVLSRKKEA